MSVGIQYIKMVYAVFVTGIGITAFMYLLRWSFTRKWINIKNSDLQGKSLEGKTVVITGGNTGLGRSVAFDLAKRKADRIVLACRNIEAGNATALDIIKCTGNPNVTCIFLDLASLHSVRQFVEAFSIDNSKLDCLICNAGVWVPMEKGLRTSDGFEIHFGVNHLGHFLLVQLLTAFLRRACKSRVVVVSSVLMNSGVLDMDNFDIYNGRKIDQTDKSNYKSASTGYCDSKLLNGLFVKQLAKSAADSGISAYSVCPGWCNTDLMRNATIPFYKKLIVLPFIIMIMRSSVQGAGNIIYGVLQEEDKLENGGCYKDGKLQEKENKKLETLMEEGVGKKVWRLSEKLCNRSLQR